jgi:spermidine/putrescine transport system substrate-binding protein
MGDPTERENIRSEKDLTGLIDEIKHGRMDRRQFVERALLMGLSATAVGAVLSACGSSTSSATESASPAAMDTTLPTTLHFYNWSDYLAPATKKNFKKETGITLVESYFEDNEALLSKLKAGAQGYDVMCPSDYMIHIMIKTGLLEPLNMDYIPNFANVGEKFKNPPYDNPSENGGAKYSVPWQWGNTGIGVRLDKVKEPVTEWTVLWDPKWKGQINMENEMRETMGVGLAIHDYSMSSTSQQELDAATEKLIAQKPLVNAYDTNNMKRYMTQGLPLVHAWNADTLIVQDQIGFDKLAYVLPRPRYDIWIDNLAIPKGSNSPYGAHVFMNFVLDPQNAADLVDWVWYLSPVPKAYDLVKNKVLVKTYPTEDQLAYGEIMNDVGAFTAYYDECWQKVKSA